ncbi:thioredoxin domain-containing protein [Paraflavisolibacter sp. H34]|uniref:thioredoxin domain-containing protein n=1 Tax=Huijunlia imazamoxiresistens TaxID=3127457 RepID=UPI0039C9E91C
MRNTIIAAFLFVSLAAAGSCRAQQGDLPVTDFQKGTTGEGIQLLDVRTLAEYNGGHLKNAFLADWTRPEAFRDRTGALDKSRPVYVYCLSGGRSRAAAAALREQGFTQVYNLVGGITAWKGARLPVEGKATTRQMTLEEFRLQIPSDKTVLVDVGAAWCPPCKRMEPLVQEVLRERGAGLVFLRVDGGEQEKLAADLGAETFPTFIVYKNGKEVWRQSGLLPKEALLKPLQ